MPDASTPESSVRTATVRDPKDAGADAARLEKDGRGPSGPSDFGTATLPESAPELVGEIAPGTWKAISTNTLADVDPEQDTVLNPKYPQSSPWHGNSGQSGVIAAWCGGAFAYGFGKYGALLVWGGGHQDYYGNEVYAFDVDKLRWSRLSDPYRSPMFDGVGAYPHGRYPDGTPVPPHSVDLLEYHPKTQSFVSLHAETNNLGGYTTSTVYLFSLEQKRWRHSHVSPKSLGSFGFSAYDGKRDVFWVEGGGGGPNPTSAFNPNPVNDDGTFGEWTQYVEHIGVNGSVAAYDPLHDLIVVTVFRNGKDIRVIDPARPREPTRTLMQSGTAPKLVAGHGWEWSEKRSAFIYWAGEHVFELKASGDGGPSSIWVWTDLTSSQNSVLPEYAANGVYGRFRIAKYGSAEIAFTVNSVSGSVYAFRIP